MQEEPVSTAHHQAPVHRVQPEPSVPVVKVLSVRGVEYGFMTLMVWAGAASLVWCGLALVYGQTGFDTLAFPVALLVTALPIFAALFIRLRKAELANPALRVEPSKRRFSHITQFLAFLICFFNIVAFIYSLMSSTTNSSYSTIGKSALSLLVILVVIGGILAYYWIDEHRAIKH